MPKKMLHAMTMYFCYSFSKKIRCGGSALNTTRVLQWLLGSINKVSFTGTLGKDANAKLIQGMTKKDHVITK